MIKEWRLEKSQFSCACHESEGSKLELSFESLKAETLRLVSRFGCHGGEEVSFRINDGIEKAKEFLKIYTEEGLLTNEVAKDVISSLLNSEFIRDAKERLKVERERALRAVSDFQGGLGSYEKPF